MSNAQMGVRSIDPPHFLISPFPIFKFQRFSHDATERQGNARAGINNVRLLLHLQLLSDFSSFLSFFSLQRVEFIGRKEMGEKETSPTISNFD